MISSNLAINHYTHLIHKVTRDRCRAKSISLTTNRACVFLLSPAKFDFCMLYIRICTYMRARSQTLYQLGKGFGHARYCTAVFHNLATAKASHMINMSDLTNQLAPITSAFHFPVARFWKTAVHGVVASYSGAEYSIYGCIHQYTCRMWWWSYSKNHS